MVEASHEPSASECPVRTKRVSSPYAGVAQVSDAMARGWKSTKGRRIPLIYWDPSGEDYRRLRLSSRPIPIPGDTDSLTVLQILA